MWRRKKVVIIGLLATVLLVGSIVGVALAQTGSASDGSGKTLLARVATILGVDQQKLESAFAQAQREMRDEALDNYLKNLVAEGKITKEQADKYKAWLQARPDMAPYRQQLEQWQQTRPGMPPELKEWQQKRPDMPLPGPDGRFGKGLGDRQWFRGGPCPPK